MAPETFRAIRLAHQLSAHQLAARLRLGDAGTVRRYERGTRAVPGPVAMLMEMLAEGRI